VAVEGLAACSDPDDADAQRDIQENLQIQRAVDSGKNEDMRGLSAEDRASVRRIRWMMRFARWLGDAPPPRRRRKPRSIEELLERSAESGTHSILDITSIAARRSFGAAAPLPEQTIHKVFGTNQPTRDQVEERWADVAETVGRWQAYYLVLFRDGQPNEYAFIGCSGE